MVKRKIKTKEKRIKINGQEKKEKNPVALENNQGQASGEGSY